MGSPLTVIGVFMIILHENKKKKMRKNNMSHVTWLDQTGH